MGWVEPCTDGVEPCRTLLEQCAMLPALSPPALQHLPVHSCYAGTFTRRGSTTIQRWVVLIIISVRVCVHVRDCVCVPAHARVCVRVCVCVCVHVSVRRDSTPRWMALTCPELIAHCLGTITRLCFSCQPMVGGSDTAGVEGSLAFPSFRGVGQGGAAACTLP